MGLRFPGHYGECAATRSNLHGFTLRWFTTICMAEEVPGKSPGRMRTPSIEICLFDSGGENFVPQSNITLSGYLDRPIGRTVNKKGKIMKKRIIVALVAITAFVCGCTSSTRIEWGGKSAVRQSDGTVLVDKDGAPYYEAGANIYKDFNWLTKREERDVSVKVNADGSYEAGLGSRVNDVSSNGVAMVTGGIDATTKLVSTCAAAYATIAGGGAQADSVASIASKIVSYFKEKGGDTSSATTTVSDGTVKVTDGSTTVLCDANGNCSESN